MLGQVSNRLSCILKELTETACRVLATHKRLSRKIEDIQTIYKLLKMKIAYRSIYWLLILWTTGSLVNHREIKNPDRSAALITPIHLTTPCKPNKSKPNSPILGYTVDDSGMGLSYRPTRPHRLVGRYDELRIWLHNVETKVQTFLLNVRLEINA
jgi:hypothetical protein